MATKKTENTDVFSFSAFDPTKITETYRDFAEKSMLQSREGYTRMKTVAEDATKTAEATLENAQAGTVELGLKAIDYMRAHTENSLSHMEALLGVKSVAEVMELQSSFFRKQMELGADHAKSMQETSRKVADDVSKPGKSAMDKAMKEAKSVTANAA
ncbi:phasin [Pararhizobium mangrovi]|uniref:Phasin n=1 Tax=Pararhizobium mangrovi TaxID=2590452 RepID=A0A506U350_9HYPH|nr:phasin [Pararhizobium mangrovi]TPW27918.1 phasin [Pararhizobium mangrovi]